MSSTRSTHRLCAYIHGINPLSGREDGTTEKQDIRWEKWKWSAIRPGSKPASDRYITL